MPVPIKDSVIMASVSARLASGEMTVQNPSVSTAVQDMASVRTTSATVKSNIGVLTVPTRNARTTAIIKVNV